MLDTEYRFLAPCMAMRLQLPDIVVRFSAKLHPKIVTYSGAAGEVASAGNDLTSCLAQKNPFEC